MWHQIFRATGHTLTILFTNDHHGCFLPNERGEGGLAAQATQVKAIRQDVQAHGGHLLLLSCGDVNTGTPESDLQNAKPDFLGMRAMQYDAMTIGNHEFDNSLKTLQQQQTWAGFPFLSANLFYRGTNQRPFLPYIIKQCANVRVAIFGLTPEDSDILSMRFPRADLELRPALEVAAALVPQLRAQADIVLALAHLGHYPDGNHQDAALGDKTLVRTVPGIDILIGGHTHTTLPIPVIENQTIIGQAADKGAYLGRIDVQVKNRRCALQQYRLYPINLQPGPATPRVQPIPADPELKRLLQPYQELAEKKLSQSVGFSFGNFDGDRRSIRHHETNLGKLIIQVMKQATGADVAVISSGLIRHSLPSGTITLRDILRVSPFQLGYTTVRLTGQELKHYLSQVMHYQPGTGKYPQLSDFCFDRAGDEIVDIMFHTPSGARPICDHQIYTLALTCFNARGGDGYPDMQNHAGFKSMPILDSEAMKRFLQDHSPLDPTTFSVSPDRCKRRLAMANREQQDEQKHPFYPQSLR